MTHHHVTVTEPSSRVTLWGTLTKDSDFRFGAKTGGDGRPSPCTRFWLAQGWPIWGVLDREPSLGV